MSPEDDIAAAEFALGVSDPAERATIAARRTREPELDAAIREWELRLAPLIEASPEVPAARDFLPEIEARIRASNPGVAELKRSVARWRAFSAAASLVACVALVGAIGREILRPAVPHEFVAVLQRSPDAPAFAISVNIETRALTVRPVSAEAPKDKSYELWIIAAKLGAPRSLGVIESSQIVRSDRLKTYSPDLLEDATYAVTVEPPGGSKTGAPSGAPVFVGKLIPVGP